jgi:hypothetical protein
MVTTPDMYPLWKTRRPVVVVLHKKGSALQHHYYRYMVVTPGASATTIGLLGDQDENAMEAETGGGGAATSNDYTEISPVMAWEDPFHFSMEENHEVSTASFRSILTTNKRRTNLANLPYRTLDIRVDDASVVLDTEDEEELTTSMDGTTQIRIDNWNAREDASYRSYLIREAVRRNRESVLLFDCIRRFQFFSPTIIIILSLSSYTRLTKKITRSISYAL